MFSVCVGEYSLSGVAEGTSNAAVGGRHLVQSSEVVLMSARVCCYY